MEQGTHHAVQKSTRTGEEAWAPCWSKFSKLILGTTIRRCVETCLTDREAKAITLRYGLDGEAPHPAGNLQRLRHQPLVRIRAPLM